ncbi:hypothetical protein [Burkholderia stabilis]|uniref:hypothetical protein n=1 Tax=Burkholderia stabilis TaxID=95485 RepID=UPI001F4A741B|nr:hypothetical protein [Burkholderia stabilis]
MSAALDQRLAASARTGKGQSPNEAFEATAAIDTGAGEIVAVINIGVLKSGGADGVKACIAAVRRARGAAPLKVILEIGLLTDVEKVRTCEMCGDLGASSGVAIVADQGGSRSGY